MHAFEGVALSFLVLVIAFEHGGNTLGERSRDSDISRPVDRECVCVHRRHNPSTFVGSPKYARSTSNDDDWCVVILVWSGTDNEVLAVFV